MYCRSITCARSGNETILLSVEADIRNGLPGFTVCGAASQEIKESKERVRVALENAGFLLPPKRITVNLSPQTEKNDRSSPDLAIALSVLSAYGYIPDTYFDDAVVVGDISLDGSLRAVKGCFSYAGFSALHGFKKIVVPYENAAEASVCGGIMVYGVKNIKEAVAALSGEIKPFERDESVIGALLAENRPEVSFNDIHYAIKARKALYYAARAGLNVLLLGAGDTCERLCKALGEHIFPLTREEKIRYLEIRNDPVIAENKEIEVHNGYVVMKDVLSNKRFDYAKFYEDLPLTCVTVACAPSCPCGAYPDRSCTCTSAKLRNHYAKIDSAILKNSVLFTHAEYGLDDILTCHEDDTYFKKTDEYDISNRDRDSEPYNINEILTEENKKILSGLFRDRPFSEREVMNTLMVSEVIARTEKEDSKQENEDTTPEIHGRHIAEAFEYCVFTLEKRSGDEG